MKIMKMGRTSVFDGPKGHFLIKELPLPDPPAPGSLLMKVEMCGVCGTDVHGWQGFEGITIPFPAPLGHEVVGTIQALGNGIETDFLGKPVKVGDRIVIVPLVTCGNCYACTVLQEPAKCLNARAYGHQSVKYGTGLTGGYSEYLSTDIPQTTFLKTELPPEIAVLLEPTSIAVSGIKRVGVTAGDTAVVQGPGAIGLLTQVVALEAGVEHLIMVGKREDRLHMAKELGAEYTIAIDRVADVKERVKLVKERTTRGLGADIVFECAGIPVAFEEGFHYIRDGGRYCELGHFTDTGSVKINPCKDICAKMIKLVGSWSSLPDDFVRALTILEKRKYPVEKLISHRLPLERVEDAFKAMAGNKMLEGQEIVKAVIAPWGTRVHGA